MTETATELRAQLAKIVKEEAVLQSKLAKEQQSILRRLEAVIYPVLTLPAEIVAEIFMHYVGNSIVTYDFVLKTYPPLLLARVCRTWRGIALSFPRLWASLRIECSSQSGLNSCEKLLQCWLPRAGGCLIDLELLGHHLPEPICDALVQHAARLRSLTLMHHLGSQLSDLLAAQQPQRCFAALETLTLRFQFGDVRQRGLRPVTHVSAFSDAPQLREVHISVGTVSRATLPWNQITTLHLYHSTPSRTVLNQAPDLEVLSFSSWGAWSWGPNELLVMTKLHTLQVRPSGPGGSHDSPLLYHLILPALRALKVGYGQRIEPLRSLISRSSCTLREMHLHNRTTEETIDCLKLSASLEHLTIEFKDDWSERVREVLHHLEANNYCSKVFGFLGEGHLPALKSLSFNAFPIAINPALLQDMLNSRRETDGIAILESFRLAFSHPVQDDCASELRALCAQGVNIHIEWPAGESSANVNPEFVARINAA
ncbi:hypothetical protein C8J57DRAFT_1334298 [Mycena rebaudengoi]|nr:hypothetical protein C8J57DRAFT_1334298 [Mycena rebaudengoi]